MKPIHTSPFSHAVLIFLLLLTTACGFHLRGSMDLPAPMKKIYLLGASAKLKREMASLLKASQGQLVESPDEASLFFKIYLEKQDKRILSLSERGKSSEFELILQLKYQFTDTKDQPLQGEQALEIRRDFYNDQQAILAKTHEEEVIRGEMYKQAARTLITRARSVLEEPQK